MCVTDLDLELQIVTDEQALGPGPRPAASQYPGVAWGLAERHDGQDQAAGGPAAEDPAEPAETY
jgi:hypothetical protein